MGKDLILIAALFSVAAIVIFYMVSRKSKKDDIEKSKAAPSIWLDSPNEKKLKDIPDTSLRSISEEDKIKFKDALKVVLQIESKRYDMFLKSMDQNEISTIRKIYEDEVAKGEYTGKQLSEGINYVRLKIAKDINSNMDTSGDWWLSLFRQKYILEEILHKNIR